MTCAYQPRSLWIGATSAMLRSDCLETQHFCSKSTSHNFRQAICVSAHGLEYRKREKRTSSEDEFFFLLKASNHLCFRAYILAWKLCGAGRQDSRRCVLSSARRTFYCINTVTVSLPSPLHTLHLIPTSQMMRQPAGTSPRKTCTLFAAE